MSNYNSNHTGEEIDSVLNWATQAKRAEINNAINECGDNTEALNELMLSYSKQDDISGSLCEYDISNDKYVYKIRFIYTSDVSGGMAFSYTNMSDELISVRVFENASLGTEIVYDNTDQYNLLLYKDGQLIEPSSNDFAFIYDLVEGNIKKVYVASENGTALMTTYSRVKCDNISESQDVVLDYIDKKIINKTIVPQNAKDGVKGTIAFDDNYLYICIKNGVWKRAQLNGFDEYSPTIKK